MLSPSQVEAAEQLLCDGMPKMRVVRTLDLSRTSVDKIAAGRHPLQSDPAGFLARYCNRRTWPASEVMPHTHSLETIERAEELLCYWWRDRSTASMVGRRLTLAKISAETGLCRRIIDHILHRTHPMQLERDGIVLPYARNSDRLDSHSCHTRESVETAEGMLGEGLSKTAVSMALRMTPQTVLKISRGIHYRQLSPLGQRLRRSHMRRVRRPPGYVPSPQAIERRCAAIQRTWSPAERLQRMGVSPWLASEYSEWQLFSSAA